MHFHILAQGTFNNYVDQILPNFDPLPPRMDKYDKLIDDYSKINTLKRDNKYLPIIILLFLFYQGLSGEMECNTR